MNKLIVVLLLILMMSACAGTKFELQTQGDYRHTPLNGNRQEPGSQN